MSKSSRRARWMAAAAVTAGTIAVAGTTLAGTAGSALADTAQGTQATAYHFVTLDNAHDVTFNQLLGINNKGLIAGYFGSGAAGHPNKGYLLSPHYGQRDYVNENFPGSVQTQVTGLNDKGVTVGFYSTMNNANMVNDNHGFWEKNGKFHTADFPTGSAGTPPVDQLLGVNDGNIAVGFWTDAAGNNHGYELNLHTGRFSTVTDKGAPNASLTAAGINSRGDIAGFYTSPSSVNTQSFLKVNGGKTVNFAYPGASATLALGVNDHDEVVGTYTAGSGANAAMHGFTWTPGGGFRTVDDPNGVGTTTINGLNNAGDLVGFYVDGAGNTDGFLAAR